MNRRGFLKRTFVATPLVGLAAILPKPKPKRLRRWANDEMLTAEDLNRMVERIERLEDK